MDFASKKCRECGGACCYPADGVPPFEVTYGKGKRCSALTESGQCQIELDSGLDAKPVICRALVVGGDECSTARSLGLKWRQ